jgi:DNA-3-methyladenine glycosylase II
MKTRKITKQTLPEVLDVLVRREPAFRRLVSQYGPPPLRNRPGGFPALIHIICAQQVSTASARAIVGRLDAAVSPLTPENLLKLGVEGLRGIGFSGQKARYGIGIAEAITEGRFKVQKLPGMEDEDAIAALTKLKGIGRWTAEIYLMFALGRPDIWPVGDLGVVKGAMILKGLETRPSDEEMIALAEPWRPWRSVAARMMWHVLHNTPTA